jgi:hypothetical protein
MSSGLVGSSTHHGSNSRSRSIAAIDPSTLQDWFASIISLRSGPIAIRISAARRTSSSRFRPTFIFRCAKPSASASRTSPPTFVSS